MKVTSGRTINYPLYDAMHKKNRRAIRPKFPTSPIM